MALYSYDIACNILLGSQKTLKSGRKVKPHHSTASAIGPIVKITNLLREKVTCNRTTKVYNLYEPVRGEALIIVGRDRAEILILLFFHANKALALRLGFP